MILVDTSVWIAHLKSPILPLKSQIERELVVMHPFVLGEILMGSVRDRGRLRFELSNLDQVQVADEKMVLDFVDQQRLFGRAISYIDAHLLASAALAKFPIWTYDKRLGDAASVLGLRFAEP